MNKFDNYLYNRLPEIYREYDNDFTLKRFLQVLESEFNTVITNTEDLLKLIDVDRCPPEYIPLLCETLGVKYEPSIPISFQRRFLKNAVMLNKRKGTLPAIRYLARELFGKEIDVFVEGRLISIRVEDSMGALGPYSEKRVLERYIKYYIPVFFELEAIFYLALNPVKVGVKAGMITGENVIVYPKPN